MDIGSIFLILALFVLVGLFVSRPFFEDTKQTFVSNADTHDRSVLLAERDRVLNALQELDFDYALGKIPEEDYPEQRGLLLQRGAEVLRSLDNIEKVDDLESSMEDRIEQAIAARRSGMGKTVSGVQNPAQVSRGVSASVASPDDDLEVMLATRRRTRQEKSTGFCPKCGGPLQQSDRFCPKCGAKS
jgi:hypothetical protein